MPDGIFVVIIILGIQYFFFCKLPKTFYYIEVRRVRGKKSKWIPGDLAKAVTKKQCRYLALSKTMAIGL